MPPKMSSSANADPPPPAAGASTSTSAAANPRKRPSPTTIASTNPDRKRARIISSRTIAAQSGVPELKTGQLNVTTFIKSRRFEIEALQSSMAASKGALKQRAFQSLPRELRRRTASHNAKRVPKRLRDRAAKEMAEDNTPMHTFRKRKRSGHDRLRAETAERLRKMAKKKEVVERFLEGRVVDEGLGGELKRPPRGHSRWRKRQKGKVWLPTHVWHAKRTHMNIRWRFAVPESPNDKCFRSTQRAVEKRGGIAWDTSYWSHILVRGEEELVVNVLEAVFKDAGDKKVKAGRRSKECWAYECGGYPEKPIAPVTIIWSPSAEGQGRRALIRVHPSGFLDVWEQLLTAMRAQNAAVTAAAGSTTPLHKVFIDDLRFELGSIQIAGPAATDALLSVLTPITPDGDTEKVWAGLRGLTNPAALPPDVVLGFDISDPRLRFPPRLDPNPLTSAEQQACLFTLQTTWPIPARPHALLDPKHRTAAVRLQPSMKHIQKRKTAAPPGEYPPPIPQDPKIPLLILTSSLSGNKTSTPSKAPGAWTVILPWKWVQPVWYALMHTKEELRFGGVQELRQVAFDHGLPWFPADFPGTAPGAAWEEEKAADRRGKWERKPRQKRLNYDAVKIAGGKGEVGEWSRCDWRLLVKAEGGEGMELEPAAESTDDTTAAVTTPAAVAGTTTISAVDIPAPPRHTWQIPSHLVASYARTRVLPPTLAALPSSHLRNGVFAVKLTLVRRGAPTDTARIYRVRRGTREPAECPGAEELVGFVTTGNYSLSEGRPVALGGVVWGAWFRDGEEGWEKERMCVVRGVGETVGRLARWEFV